MTGSDDPGRSHKLWLVAKNGVLEGTRHEVKAAVFSVGTDAANDLVLERGGSGVASSRHLEIRADEQGFLLVDLDTEHGTFINGEPVREKRLADGDLIALGPGGLRYIAHLEPIPVGGVAESVELPELGQVASKRSERQDELVAEAVRMVREARLSESSGHTTMIVRDALLRAVDESRKRHRLAIGILVTALLVVTIYAVTASRRIRQQKHQIDSKLARLESDLINAKDPERMDSLIAQIERYEKRARKLQRNLLYELGHRDEERDFVEAEIRILLEKFGADRYSIPPEFIEQVRLFLEQYETRDRQHVQRMIFEYGEQMDKIKTILADYNLPPDLAYMILVESAFIKGSRSHAGAAGIWQFMPPTARSYGLTVRADLDERYDLMKSTHAAARYLRDLIIEFGSGNSVMLALAAYNTGPTRVRREVRKVKDPIGQRNFWYLYRVRALPEETRQYVPKIFAAIIIGRNPERFGFAQGDVI